jgi:hypothetical protein
MKNRNLGQSIVELVFAIGIIVLVVTGVVALIVSNINSKSRGFDRKKATELAQIVMEDLLQKKKNDSLIFWTLDMNKIGLPSACSPPNNYVCLVTLSSPSVPCTDCVNAKVSIGWSGSGTQIVEFNRLFSKDGD